MPIFSMKMGKFEYNARKLKNNLKTINWKWIFFQIEYGRDCQPCRKKIGSKQEIFDSIDFYLGRLTRILPVYYFCLIASAILIPFGHSNPVQPFPPNNIIYHVSGSVLSIFLVQTWVLHMATPNGVAWTVSTLFFFYLFYPR